MLIDFSQSLKAVDGTILKHKEADLTLKTIACEALMASYKEETQLSGEEKHKRFKLSQRIFRATEPVNVTIEEIAVIKRLVGILYGPAVCGPVFDLLEGIVDDYIPASAE
jgi:hypothetical protein